MDPVTALGVAAAVAQFVGLSVIVSRRLREYVTAASGEVPKSLQSISTQLPLITNSLSRLQTETALKNYDAETRCVLHGVVVGCLRLVREIDEISVKLTPKPGENLTSKLKKAMSSLRVDDRIAQVDRGLQAHVQVLILHRVVDSSEVLVPTEPETDYFGVKEKRTKDFIERSELLSQLDEAFHAAARCQVDRPTYVVLHGKSGAGKSRLAVEYCHLAYEQSQFRTVFWLDAASPILLKTGLESVASEIRKSRAGTSQEKLNFINEFFTGRYQSWLIVIDNYRSKAFDNDPLNAILPQSGYGGILITTRDSSPAALGSAIQVHRYLTEKDKTKLFDSVTTALRNRDLAFIRDAIADGLDVNNHTSAVWNNEGPSFLSLAAILEFNDGVKLLLQHGARQVLNANRAPAIGDAILNGHISTVKLFLQYEDDTEEPLSDNSYDLCFLYAIERGKMDILSLLLERRSHRYAPNRWPTRDSFSRAFNNGHLDIITLLVEEDKLPTIDQSRWQLINHAIRARKFDLVQLLVLVGKIDLRRSDQGSEPPLWEAANMSGKPEDEEFRNKVLKFLIENGAPVNGVRESTKQTALHRAASSSVSTVRLLLDHGADAAVVDERNHTPLMRAAAYKSAACYPPLTQLSFSDPLAEIKHYAQPLLYAARKGDRDLVLAIAKHKNVIDTVDEESGDTALLAAIRHSQTPVARMLLRIGANPQIAARGGMSPLHLASEKGLHLVVRDLVQSTKGVPAIEADFPDDKGNTALMIATRAKHQNVVEVLLKMGADREVMNNYGETALDIAEEKAFDDLIKLLEQA